MRSLLLLISFVILQSCSTKLMIPVDHKQSYIAEMVHFLADDRLQGRETGTQGEKLAADYIALQFRELDLIPAGDNRKGNPTYFQSFQGQESNAVHGDHQHDMPFDPKSINGKNVVGFLDNGAVNTVVFGAHYDHLGFGGAGSLYEGGREIHNGADDNASGVAVMIYIAKLLKENKVKHSNFLFIAFSGEEKGLWGSNYYSKNPARPLSEVNYMINFDMVGRLKDQRLAINGTGTSPHWSILDKANPGFQLIKSESGIGPSDHTSFYLQDIPAIHFFTGQHEDYHKPSDDVDKVNYKGCYEIAHYVYRIVEKTKGKKITFAKTKDEDMTAVAFKVTLGVIPDYLFQEKGMRIDGVRTGKTADVAGIVKGDIVIKMGDIEIVDMQSYMNALAAFEPGETTKVTVLREGVEVESTVTFQ